MFTQQAAAEYFISEIRNHPVLWDSKDPDFNNRHAKLAAWVDVATKVHEDSETWSRYEKFSKVREIQKRWKNMRDCFVRELKYEKKVDKGLAKPKKRRYMYAELLSFLSPGSQEKSNKSPGDTEESSSEQGENENEETNLTADFNFCTTMDSHQEAHDVDSNQNTGYQKQGNSYLEDYLRQQGCYQSVSEPCNDERLQPFQASNSHMVNNTSVGTHADHMEFDDDRMFLLSLLPYFKKMDDAKKLQTRIELTKLVYDKLYKTS